MDCTHEASLSMGLTIKEMKYWYTLKREWTLKIYNTDAKWKNPDA